MLKNIPPHNTSSKIHYISPPESLYYPLTFNRSQLQTFLSLFRASKKKHQAIIDLSFLHPILCLHFLLLSMPFDCFNDFRGCHRRLPKKHLLLIWESKERNNAFLVHRLFKKWQLLFQILRKDSFLGRSLYCFIFS